LTASGVPSRLSLGNLLAYAAPALPLAILGLPLNVHLPAFWAGPMGLRLATVGLVLTLVRLTDVVIDPAIGRLSDRWHTRFGRRRPPIMLAIPIGLAGGAALFFPPSDAGPVWLFFSYLVLTLGWSMIALPWQAWGAELSNDYRERTRIVSWREALTLLGIVVSAVIPAVMGLSNPAVTLHILAALCAALSLPALLVLLTMVREPVAAASVQPGLRQSLSTAWANRPFRRLLAAWALNGIANGLPAVLFLLLCRHLLHAPEQSGPLLLAFFATGILSVPLWSWIAGRIGKHRAWCWAMLWTCAAFLPVLALGPGDTTAFLLICLGTGAGLGADLALPPSMQADVIDLDTLNHGEARAGLFFAAWTMAQKAGNALSAGLAFVLLDLAGFNAQGENGASQIAVLVGLYCLLPVALKLGAVTLVWNFPIDARKQADIRAALLARGQTA
jgi:GPH family glycoside/pentoside/hexuronide:cation symporter